MVDSSKRPKVVGNFIRQKREALNLSQRALGMLFDPPVTTQFISNVERGVTPLPPAHVATLTKALQVSEAELMALLEKEYTLKLSGRLGLPQESVGPAKAGAIALPMNNGMPAPGSATFEVCRADFALFENLYKAYKLANPKVRQTFESVAQSVLGLEPDSDGADVAQTLQNTTKTPVSTSDGERH